MNPLIARMNRKWLYVVVLVLLAAIAVITALRSNRPVKIFVRLVGQRIDAEGQPHFIYEFTNATANPIAISPSSLEALSPTTGWYRVTRSPTWEFKNGWDGGFREGWRTYVRQVYPRVHVESFLKPKSAATMEIWLTHPEGTAVAIKGRLQQIQLGNQPLIKALSIAYKLRLPTWLLAPKPDFIQLPTAELPSIATPTKAPVSKSAN